MKRNVTLEIKGIEIIEKIYPRSKVNEGVVKDYAKKMDDGFNFPNIEVASLNGKNILVDGRHRIEARKERGEKYIAADIHTDLKDINEIFIASVRANERHGLRLTKADKKKIAYTMKDLEFEVEQITQLTGITFKTMQKEVLPKLRREQVIRKIKENKMPIFIKETLKQEDRGKIITKEEEKRIINDNKTQWQIDELERINEYLKGEKLDLDDKRICNIISKIKKTLNSKYPKL